MRASVLDEPELEFGNAGRHIDPRHGIASHGPLDAETGRAPERIRVGIVGPAHAVDGIRNWLSRAREPIAGKSTSYEKQRAMFPPFPGFDSDHTFRSLLVFDDRAARPIASRTLEAIGRRSPAAAVAAAVEAYIEQVDWIADNCNCDVIICARPETLDTTSQAPGPGSEDTGEYDDEDAPRPLLPDFHDQLKGVALRHPMPLQIIRPRTWGDPSKPPRGVIRTNVQDEATRAWNLHTALYYKAGGRPWRLIRSYSDVATCYLGVSFYKSVDNDRLHTSVAQLFNERGEGVVVKGGPAAVLKEDRQPHLAAQDAEELVRAAINAFRHEHGHFPARLVVHKSSSFNNDERDGFDAGAAAAGIDQCELIWLSTSDPTRFFRPGEHPPLRGTLCELAPDRLVLYTKGSIDFYGAYPGMYIPAPLSIRPATTDHDPGALAAETLALTKLNWNHSQLDAHLPITLMAASKVKAILRHLPGEAITARHYAHYM